MKRLIAALVMLAAAPTGADAQGYSTMSHEGLRAGTLVRQSDCPDRDGHAWAAAPYPGGPEEGVCIRYFAAGFEAANRSPVVFLHGNRLSYIYDAEGRLIRVGVSDSYGTPDEASLQRAAQMQAAALGRPFIILARPGHYGSSGIATEQYRWREGRLVSAALDVIKRHHSIESFGVAAQSGGGPSLAGLLEQRTDISCAAFSSALTAISVLERERTPSRVGRTPTITERTPELYDPIREVSRLPVSDTRRIFVVSDPGDRSISVTAQQAYTEALRQNGHRVAATTSTAVGPQHHSLGATGQRAVGWCLEGMADDQILARMSQGEADYVISGGFY